MKLARQLTAAVVLMGILSSCGPKQKGNQYVRQRIPIQIQRGKPVTVEILSLSGNGVNDVGIQCSPQVWNVLTNGTKAIEVRLKSSDKLNTQISGVDPTSSGTAFLGYISNVHYLFYISGEHRAKASVEITFPNAPEGPTHAEIIICKTPADTGL
jgi:hypothetical protein